jgi:Type VI secretion system/phage-baseplate injector OB domain
VRAALIGFQVWVEGTTLFFDRRDFGPPVPVAPRRRDGEAKLVVFHPQLASSATVQQGCHGGYVMLNRLRRADLGLFRTPAIDDEVLVGFEHGDIRQPVIVGSLWDPDPRRSKHRP